MSPQSERSNTPTSDDGKSTKADNTGVGFLTKMDLPSLIEKSSVNRQQFDAVQFLARYGTDEEERLLYMNKIRSIAEGTVPKKRPALDLNEEEDDYI